MPLLSSKIRISDLRVYAYIGVLPHEKVAGNEYTVSLEVTFNAGKAMRSDNVADTINYALLAQLIYDEMALPCDLLEHAAGRILQRIMDEYQAVELAMVEITKCVPPIRGFQAAGVSFSAILQR